MSYRHARSLRLAVNHCPAQTRSPSPDGLPHWTHAMTVARITEISSISTKSFEDAVVQGVDRANKTLKNVKGAWIKDQEVTVENGKVSGYKVILKITFVLE